MRTLDTAPTRHHPRQGPASGDVVLHHQRPPAVPLHQAWVASTEVFRGHLAGVPQEAAGPGPAVLLAPGTQQPRVPLAGDQVWVAGHRGHGGHGQPGQVLPRPALPRAQHRHAGGLQQGGGGAAWGAALHRHTYYLPLTWVGAAPARHHARHRSRRPGPGLQQRGHRHSPGA